MSDIFASWRNYKPPVKKHFVTIDGKKIQVNLEKKLEIMRHGEEKYMIKPAKFGPEIKLRPRQKTKRVFTTLANKKNGMNFLDNDPCWVEGTTEEGYEWQIESE
tara:strand:+ start:1136 stop:1447 length:312 start_codon:yes stop_codon:yes gene_type:complete